MEEANAVDPNNNIESDNEQEEVRTLFVSGLPTNVRSREIYLLFRAYKGYEGFQLKLTDKQGKPSPVAFVTFLTREDAEECKKNLQCVRFDPEVNQTLRTEFAKTNTKVNKMAYRNHISTPKTVAPHEALTPLDLTGHSFFASEPLWHHARIPYGDSPSSPLPSPLPSPLHSPIINHFPPTVQHHVYQPMHAAALQPNAFSLRPAPIMTSPQDSTICSTLFVANFGKTCTEIDIHNIFSRTQGFKKVKLLNKGNAPCCFVEYQDIFSAAQAMNMLQGYVMSGVEGVRGGIRIEYARTRMGEPRYIMNGETVITSHPSSPLGPPINITTYS